MKASDIPPRFEIPFAASAGGPFITYPIPKTSQIGVSAGRASLTDGFVPLNMTPIGAGGVPPFGQDMNGLLKQTTLWSQWQGAGGPVPWDSSFSVAIGGYPAGTILAAANSGYLWYCTVDDNLTNPNLNGAGWAPIALVGGSFTTGDMKFRSSAELLPGWVIANATTIGNASSNATQRANADTILLYAYIWNTFTNAQCPIFTSAGAPSTRGANANVDYAANKAIAVPDWRGAGPMGIDTMQGSTTTLLAGVPVVAGALTVPGSVFGENLHALAIGELAAHGHSVTDPGHVHAITDPQHAHGNILPFQNPGGSGGTIALQGASVVSGNWPNLTINAAATGISINSHATGLAVDATGSGTGHNTVQRSVGVTWYVKL